MESKRAIVYECNGRLRPDSREGVPKSQFAGGNSDVDLARFEFDECGYAKPRTRGRVLEGLQHCANMSR
jgi:hypothetical protein